MRSVLLHIIGLTVIEYVNKLYKPLSTYRQSHQDIESRGVAGEQAEQRQHQQQLSESDYHQRWLQSGKQP